MRSTISIPTAPPHTRAAFANWGVPAFRHYWSSPFARARLEAAGIRDGAIPTPEEFARITPTTKDELRQFSDEAFYRDFVRCAPTDIATVWRSGGVTGRPLFYPRARRDFPVLVESFMRCLDMLGVGRGDLLQNSFPLGLHPLGNMFNAAAERMEIGTLSAGAGTTTASETQVKLLFDLHPTAFVGLASYLVHLGHIAEAENRDLRSAGVRVMINSGEALTPAKRQRIQNSWGTTLRNTYGMSECSMMGAECEVGDGFHVWTDMFYLEILDPTDWATVPRGKVGMIVVTPLHNCSATPFLRWVSGDLGSFLEDCNCSSPYRVFPRVRLAGRTSGFSKVKGVNVNHQEMDDVLLSLESVADFCVWFELSEGEDRIRIEVESSSDRSAADAMNDVSVRVRQLFEVRPVVQPLPRGTIARRLEEEVKPLRFRDLR